MTWDGQMTWTRSPPGDPDSVVGTWTASMGSTTYTVVAGSDGSVALFASGIYCIEVQSGHDCNGMGDSIQVNVGDSNMYATEVWLSGPGLSGSQQLEFNSDDQQWKLNSTNGSLYPSPLTPAQYWLTIIDADHTHTFPVSLEKFYYHCPACVSPADGARLSGDITFSWDPVPEDPEFQYYTLWVQSSGDYRNISG